MRYASHGMTTVKQRSVFYVHRVTDDAVYIVDMAEEVGSMSVTNDAEAVVHNLNSEYGNRRFIYRDTMGQWDELVHENGKFTSFRPHRS
jgi:hypothetical protein